MIQLTNMTKKYGQKIIFSDFNLKIDQGQMVAITGSSGSGKSTLLNIIGLIEGFDQGTYDFMGHINTKPNSRTAQRIIRSDISYLFQNFALIEDQTVAQNLLLALKYVHKAKDEKKKIIKSALANVGLKTYLNRKVYELSGGQQQRVAVARAIIKPSKIILADEPTGSLDVQNRDEIFNLLTELNKKGKTIVIVTHDVELANRCKRVVELQPVN